MDRRLIAHRLHAVGNTDRDHATVMVSSLYRLAGLDQPEVVWVGSPRAALLEAMAHVDAYLHGPDAPKQLGRTPEPDESLCFCGQCATASVAGRLAGVAFRCIDWDPYFSGEDQQLLDRARRLTGAVQRSLERDPVVGGFARPAHWPDFSGSMMTPSTKAMLGFMEQPRRQIREYLQALNGASFGNQWLTLLPAVAGRAHRGRAFRTYCKLAATAGWWYAYRNLVVLSDRPATVHSDQSDRLHNPAGPAVVYPDGWGVNALHGTVLPPWFFDPASYTVETILAEANLEARRLLIDRYGTDRFASEGGARIVHQDKTGRLWNLGYHPSGRPEMAVVEVTDATPQPGGRRRRYWLHVPPDMNTAHRAVAWTFGLTADEYRPEVET